MRYFTNLTIDHRRKKTEWQRWCKYCKRLYTSRSKNGQVCNNCNTQNIRRRSLIAKRVKLEFGLKCQ